MKNILIINLRRIGDVYTTGHLVNSLTHAGNCNVSLLVYNECTKAAANLCNIHKTYSVNRKEVITLKTNKLFSDGLALEQLYTQLQEIKNQHWDEIINYSNDLVGAYICSYLRNSTQKIIGIHFGGQKNILTSNDWELLFNDILPSLKYTPIHFIDCYHKMAGIPHKYNGRKVLVDSENETTSSSNMSFIKKTFSASESNAKIVGIQLKTSDTSKDIPEEILIDLIALLRETKNLIPVLLVAPIEEEKKYALDINEKFSNELVVIEADLRAVASVLANIDILITPDTAIKHIADLVGTPLLEISLGHAPFLKQGSYSREGLILTDIVTERNFKQVTVATDKKSHIKAQDIISSVLYYFSKTKSIRPRLSDNVTLYACSYDSLGARYSVVAGSTNAQAEIHRLMSRQLITSLYDQNDAGEIYNDIMALGHVAATVWCQREKSGLVNMTKDLLGTLRALIQSMENRKNSKDFVLNLGKLIAHSENESIMQIPLMMFKVKIESISAKSFDENAKEVEILLYELKSDMQKVLPSIKELEDRIATQRKDDFIKRPTEQTKD